MHILVRRGCPSSRSVGKFNGHEEPAEPPYMSTSDAYKWYYIRSGTDCEQRLYEIGRDKDGIFRSIAFILFFDNISETDRHVWLSY